MATNWQQQIYDDYQKRKGLQAASLPSVEPAKQIIRQSKREPNKTERRFEMDYLTGWLAAQEIKNYEYEGMTLEIANGCTYTPDWAVNTRFGGTIRWQSEIEFGYPGMPLKFYEIKARQMIFDDAVVKLKVAAAKYPQFQFFLCAYESKTGWIIQEVLA